MESQFCQGKRFSRPRNFAVTRYVRHVSLATATEKFHERVHSIGRYTYMFREARYRDDLTPCDISLRRRMRVYSMFPGECQMRILQRVALYAYGLMRKHISIYAI